MTGTLPGLIRYLQERGDLKMEWDTSNGVWEVYWVVGDKMFTYLDVDLYKALYECLAEAEVLYG